MRSSKRIRPIWPSAAILLLAVGLLVAPGPALSQSDEGMSGSNPTAQAVSEQQLLEALDRIDGRVSIPDERAAVLQQPAGRDYRTFREGLLPWIGGVAVIGMLLLLAVFYFIRGRVRQQTPDTGVPLKRFNVVERFTHWMTATAFIVLAITGLNFIFGKRILMPLIGPEAFSAWSQWSKYAHDAISWLFMAGVLMMFVLWIKDNIPDRHDVTWMKKGGGLFDKSNSTHPPATRFNAGQKLVFWAVVLGGIAMSVSGILLLMPFSFLGINGMQIAQYFHSTVAMIMVAVILGHIYIGTLGMEGAYRAMGSGDVDLAWAKEHHPVWVEKQRAKTETGHPQMPPGRRPAAQAD